MYYESYEYHSANTEPVNRICTNKIYGVELEIDDDSTNVRQILDECVEENIITVPYNEEYTNNLKVMEDDGSVYKEIILNADIKEALLTRIKCLNEYGLNPDNVSNTGGTSAHIHINRRLLNEKGISITNIYKTIEFYAPIIYAVSGRTPDSFQRWAEPLSKWKYEGEAIDWKKRGENISYIEISSYRYHLVNIENSATVEIRGFSNSCNFNYETLNFYLDLVEFFIDAAEFMKGKYFKDEGENLINLFNEWINKEHPDQLNKNYQLRQVIKYDKDLKKLLMEVTKHNHTKNHLNRMKIYDYGGLNSWIRLFDYIFYHAPEHAKLIKRVTISSKGYENILNKIINKEQQTIKSLYMEYYRNHKNELLQEV